jgi:hypothetical protein
LAAFHFSFLLSQDELLTLLVNMQREDNGDLHTNLSHFLFLPCKREKAGRSRKRLQSCQNSLLRTRVTTPIATHAENSIHTSTIIPQPKELHTLNQNPPQPSKPNLSNLLFSPRNPSPPPLPQPQTQRQQHQPAASTSHPHPALLTPFSTPVDLASEAGVAVSTMDAVPAAVGVGARR